MYLYCISQSHITKSLLIREKIGLSLDGTGTDTKALVIVPSSLRSDPSRGFLPRNEEELGKGWLWMPTILTLYPIGYTIPRSFFQLGVMPGSVSNRLCVVSLSSWSFLPPLSVGRFGGFVTSIVLLKVDAATTSVSCV